MIKRQDLRPERDFQVDEKMTFDEIVKRYEQRITITGCVRGVDVFDKKIFVSLGNNIEGILTFDESSIDELKGSSDTPVQVRTILKKRIIRAKILKIEDGKIYLSRKANLLEVLKKVKENIGGLFNATAENVGGHNVFCDIGEGLIAYCSVEEVSRIRIKDTREWVKIGQHFTVKVTDICKDNNFIWCSIKRGSYGDYSVFKHGMKVRARVGNAITGEDGNITGYYVEITPAISGIADLTAENYSGELPKYGDIVNCYVRVVYVYEHKMKLYLIN